MTNLYEHARADGDPGWSEGSGFGVMWDDVFDQLRFHKGAGFVITDRHAGTHGPIRRLVEVEDLIGKQLDGSPEMRVFEIRSVKDGFAIVVRRDHVPPTDKGAKYLQALQTKTGLGYLLGGVIPGPTDCSGLTMWGLERMGIDGIPHNAAQQHALFGHRLGFVPINRSQLKRGDLLFIDDDHHVASYFGTYHGHEAVVDTEPHDTGAPSGWPSANLGTGVRIRPMDGNYYCARVNGCGRIVEINGQP